MNIFENKTILVTGATGLLGTHLISRLLNCEGCKVIALGRKLQKLETVFKDYSGKGILYLVEGDVAEAMPYIPEGIDYIFHAASPIAGDIIRNYPVSVIKPNILGLINCLEYLRKRKAETGIDGSMVVFSSATVYANMTDNDYFVTEENTSVADNLDASNAPYSESKRMAEVIARSYWKQFEVRVMIARFSYLYGYSLQAPNTAFYEFINKSLRRENLLLNNNGAARRDNIFVEDAVDGLLCLCEKGNAGEAYNISSSGDKDNFAAIDEIAEAIAESANSLLGGANITVSFRETVEGRKPGLALDNRKLKSLGWGIKYSLKDGISKTLKDYIG